MNEFPNSVSSAITDHSQKIILDNICKHGDMHALEFLLQFNLDVSERMELDREKTPVEPTDFSIPLQLSLFNVKSEFTGRSPFHYLIRFEHVGMVKVLFDLQHKINRVFLNYTTASVCNWNIFHEIAKNGNITLLQMLLEEIESEIVVELLLQQTAFGSTPMHLSIVHKHEIIADRLIHFYISKQNSYQIKFLEMLSLVNLINKSILHLAIEKKLSSLCNTIADIIESAESDLQQNAEYSKEYFSRFLKVLELRDQQKTQIFHLFCGHKDDLMFAQLFRFLQFGHVLECRNSQTKLYAPLMQRLITSKDIGGNTIFHYALASNSKYCAVLMYRYFLLTLFHRQKERNTAESRLVPEASKSEQERGSRNPFNITNNNGQSALFLACKKNHFDLVRYLLLSYKSGEADLLEKIYQSVKEENIDKNFLLAIRCTTEEQENFIQKCIYAIRASIDTLLDKRNQSIFTESNSHILNEIFSQFHSNKLISS
jgi:ankyrin repeat protein